MISLRSQSGFSLVELSIVLVILGLLTGGILGGQALIRAAELRAVSTEYNRWVTATQTFRDKYFALPGDMTNATAFWGQSPNCPGSHTQGSTDGTTCNGNGDGFVYFTGIFSSPTANEVHRFWQHLASAQLIEGSYSGVTSSPTGYYLGVNPMNAPRSRISNGVWAVTRMPNSGGTFMSNSYARDIRVIAIIGGQTPDSWPFRHIFRPEEAWNIDNKMDDGLPGTGKVVSTFGSQCSTGANIFDLSAQYQLTASAVGCFLIFSILE